MIYNFATKCNMSCQFCYIPFAIEEEVRHEVAQEVLRALSRWPSIRSLTFGGGDPLVYPFFGDLAAEARALWGSELFLQLDTNGLALSRRRLESLAPMVDLLGLPLDAASDEVNLRMRGNATQWRRVPRLLVGAATVGLSVKVNTVVAKPNLAEIGAIGKMVAEFSPSAWSLYEFWPVGDLAFRKRNHFEVSPDAFHRVATHMRTKFADLTIEVGSQSERTNAYFFVTPSGRAYAIDPVDRTRYLMLGNVLRDADVVARWDQVGDHSKNAERFERRISQ